MNHFNYKIFKSGLMTWALLALLFVSACENEFKKEDTDPNTAPPEITSVSEAREDVVVGQGVLGNTYIIRGRNLSSLVSIQFNGTDAGFNPALVTDEIVFVRVPMEAPFLDQDNIMRLETQGGVIEYDFPLLTVEGFTEETVDGEKVVNLIGGDFTDVSKVTFVSGSEELGNLVEREAEIVSITQSRVTAKVPAGVTQAFIFIETSRGAIVQSESFGFSYSIYIDGLNEDWVTSEWGGTHDLASQEVALGETSIKSIREGWSGLTFLPENADIGFSDFTSITVQIFGQGDILSVNMALNDFAASVNLPLTSGEWNKFTIPLSDFYPNGGAPDEIFRIDFQESSNTGLPQYIFFVDDFGFL